jgi:hypothetical protein
MVLIDRIFLVHVQLDELVVDGAFEILVSAYQVVCQQCNVRL